MIYPVSIRMFLQQMKSNEFSFVFKAMADHQPSILFRQDNLGTSGTMSGGFEEMENSRRITSNFLFGNTTLSYDFGLMNPMAMDQQTEQIDFSNNNITFVQSNQRTKYNSKSKILTSFDG